MHYLYTIHLSLSSENLTDGKIKRRANNMSVPYYIGAKAIAERLGYKSPALVMRLVERAGLPVYKRRVRHRTGCIIAFAISESAITAWELTQGQHFVNETRAKRALKLERQQGALTQ